MIIYKIQNKINGKVYIGQTIQPLHKRLNQHKCKKYASVGKSVISQAIQKHGFKNFEVEIIGRVDSYERMDEYERKAITFYNCISPNGYNLTSGGQSQGKRCKEVVERIASKNRGRTHTVESRKNMSEAHKGLTYPTARKPVKGKCIETGVEVIYDKLTDVIDDGFRWESVGRCCRGERKQYKGYLWTFKDSEYPKDVKLNTWLKYAIGENLTTGETKIFYNPSEMREDGFISGNVSHVCRGHKKSHKGWRFRRFGEPFRN